MRIPLALLLALAAGPASKTWTFDADPPGAVPPGFAVGSGRWEVAEVPGQGRAVAQRAESPDDAFNVLLADGPVAADVDLSVRIQAVDGSDDQGGGLVWRARDPKNYYIARFNHLEDNFRLYKVVDGKRSPPLANAEVDHHDGWTALRVTMTGDRIACYLDGKKLLDARDATFAGPGKVGLWSKADARTLFDDLTLDGR